MLQFKEVAVSIKGKTVVKNINFTAKRGSVTVLLGKNGAGKSTLLHTLSGFQSYRGDVLLSGDELRTYAPRERARKICVLPQILPHSTMTVEELLELGRCPYVNIFGKLTDMDRAAIDDAMERTGVSCFRERALNTLSGGERQRAYIAMMLACGGELMVLDEPTAFMDLSARRELYDLLRRLKTDGKAILITLHDLSEAVRIADDIVVLDKGNMIFAGSKAECLQRQIPETVFDVTRRNSGEDIFFI